jgi:hypothetical protein
LSSASRGAIVIACVVASTTGCSSASRDGSSASAPPELGVAVRALTSASMPSPAPLARAVHGDPAEANAVCEGCHVEEAIEWRRSQHRSSWEDPIFLVAYALEPQPFCRSCHAPEAALRSNPSIGARRVGVGCITCHEPGDVLLDATPSGAAAPHPVTHLAAYGTAAACAGCHDFDFPFDPGTPMQSTAREHAARGDAAPCRDCHMPIVRDEDGRPRRRHDFTVVGEASMLARAVQITARWLEGGAIEIALARGDVGHALPTGDMFRRVELRAELLDASGQVLAALPTRAFARSFAEEHAGPVMTRRPTGDTRLFVDPDERSRRIVLGFAPDPRARSVRYTLVHLRMDHRLATLFGWPEHVNETPFARGELELPAAGPLAKPTDLP